jgi:hypothetical protein
MSTEHGPDAKPGFYFEELPRFDQRQAWTGRLERGMKDQFISVGDNETLRFPAVREHKPIGRLDSDISRAREAISTGTVRVEQLRNTKSAAKDLQSAIEKLKSPSEELDSVHQVLQAAIRAEEVTRGNEIIYRAAGHIAARNNLWIVTKSLAVEKGGPRRPRNIAVARLVGLTFSDTDNGRPVLPVVRGKNGKASKLDKVIQDSYGRMYPPALEMVESMRSKPLH